MKKSSMVFTLGIVGIVIVIVVVAIILLANHKSDKNSSLTVAQTTSAKQQIQKNWQTFFAASSSLQERESLLQNGSKFEQQMKSEFAALGAESPSATINSITLKGTSAADVNYTVKLNGQPVLTNQAGEALLVGNTWKVSDSTLCGLLAQDGSKPSVCQNE